MKPKFEIGVVLSTKAAKELVLEAKCAGQPYIERHAKGDFGDVGSEQKRQNKANIADKTGQVISEYLLDNGTRLQIVTDFENEATAFRAPREDCSYLLKHKRFPKENEN